jgi:hypothetical protein
MTIDDLKPGLYRLTADVKNPHPDRRKTHDWRAEVKWPAGLIFMVRNDVYGLRLYTGRYSHMDIPATRPPDRLHEAEARTLSMLVALVAALVRHEPVNVDQALKAEGLEDWKTEAIDLLVSQGVLKPADVVKAARAAREEVEGA